jgi:two-component system, cell cycle sensor histidine kinase and response regulator CckA
MDTYGVMEGPHNAPDTGHEALTILLIDDDEGARTAARRMIERLGHHVVAVADAKEAIAIFEADPQRFHCAVLDLAMPVLGGEQCFHELRRLRPELPVIFASGSDQGEMEARLADRPRATFLQKPYPRAALEAKLRSLIG